MTRRTFFVCIPEKMMMYEMGNGRCILEKNNDELYGIFFSRKAAIAYSKKLSTMNPGFEIQLTEGIQGYYTPNPEKVIEKKWVSDSEYVSA